MKESKPEHCQWCGVKSADLDKDHVIPRFMGGMHSLFLWSCRAREEAIGKSETHVNCYSPASVLPSNTRPGVTERAISRPTEPEI